MRQSLLALFAVVLLAAGLYTHGVMTGEVQAQSYWDLQQIEFADRWNNFAELWNSTTGRLMKGEYPLKDFRELERRFERLRESPMWPKDEKKRRGE